MWSSTLVDELGYLPLDKTGAARIASKNSVGLLHLTSLPLASRRQFRSVQLCLVASQSPTSRYAFYRNATTRQA